MNEETKEKITQQLIYLSKFDATKLTTENVKPQMENYFYLVSKLFHEIQNEETPFSSNLFCIPMIIVNLITIQIIYDSKFQDKNHDLLKRIVQFQFTPKEGEIKLPEELFNQKIHIPNIDTFLKRIQFLNQKTTNYKSFIEFSFAVNKDMHDLFPEIDFDVFPTPIHEIFSEFEYTKESVESIFDIIPDLENPELFLMFRYFNEIIYGENMTARISAQPLLDVIISPDFPEISNHDLCRLILYFSAHMKVYQDNNNEKCTEQSQENQNKPISMIHPKYLQPMLIGNYIEIDNFKITDNATSFDIFAITYYQNSIIDKKSLQEIMKNFEQFIQKKIFLTSYVISNAFLDVKLVYLIKESLVDSKAAIQLLSHPECIQFLNHENPNHIKILSFLQTDSKDIKLPTEYETIYDLIKLYRYSEFRKKNPLVDAQQKIAERDTVSEILRKIADYAIETTLSYTNSNGSASALIQGGFLPPQLPAMAESPILNTEKSFFETFELTPFQKISTIINLLCDLEIDTSITDDIIVLLTHSYITTEVQTKLKEKIANGIYQELYNKEVESLVAQAAQDGQQNNDAGQEQQQNQIPEPDSEKIKEESKNILTHQINTFISNMIVLGIIESDSQLQTSYCIATHKNLPDQALISTLKLLQNNPTNLLKFFVNSKIPISRFDFLPLELKLDILKLLIESDRVDQILQMPFTTAFNTDVLLELCGKYIVDHTECISMILVELSDKITNIDPFLRNLPNNLDFPESTIVNNKISNPPALFLNLMNNVLLSHCYDESQLIKARRPFTSRQNIECEWSEDTHSNFDGEDIWHKPIQPHICSTNNDHKLKHNLFKCYTCPSHPQVCEYCAALCHYSHDLVYIGMGDKSCKCAQVSENKCLCSTEEQLQAYLQSQETHVENKDQNVPNTKEQDHKNGPTLYHADPNLLVKTLLKMANSKQLNMDDLQSSGFLIPFHHDIKTWDIPPQMKGDSKLAPPLIFKKKSNVLNNVGTGCNVSNDLKRINESFLLTRRRAEVAPMPLGMPVRNSQYVLECCGCTARVLSKDLTQEISTIQVRKVVLMVSICPTDESVVAISTLSNVYIFDISERGIISQRCEVNLNISDYSSSSFVNSVRWIPSKPDHLMVVCNTFINVFNIANDPTTPISKFKIDRSKYITSSTIVMRDGKPFGVFGVHPNKIGFLDLTEKAPDNNEPVKLSSFTSFSPPDDQIVLSVSEEANMLFLSCPNVLLVMRPEEIFSDHPTYTTIRTGFEGQLSYLCMYPNLPLLVFTHTITNALFTLVFNDDDCVFSCLHSTKIPIQTLAALENTMSLLSVFPFHDKIIAVSAQNGGTYELDINIGNEKKVDAALAVDTENEQFETIDSSSTVPPSFWTEASNDTRNIEVFNAMNDSINVLLNGCRYIFNWSNHKKSVFVKLNNSERVIIGFRVSVGSNGEGHCPPWIAICNKQRFTDGSQRSYMIPLEPKDIEPLKTYEIIFGSRGDHDINFDSLEVFHINKTLIEKIYKKARGPRDWKDSSNLCDFTPPYPENILQACSLSIAHSFTPAPLSDDEIEQLVSIAYTNNSFCYAARQILSKCNSEDKEVKWAQYASKICNNIKEERKAEFWRDFQLFPQTAKSTISDSIWEQCPIKEQNPSEDNNNEKGKEDTQSIDEGLILSAFFSTV